MSVKLIIWFAATVLGIVSVGAADVKHEFRNIDQLMEERHKRSPQSGTGRIFNKELFRGSHCLESFDVSDRTIIKANDSVKNGATYLGEEYIDTFEFCLKLCCDTPFCTVAVWDKDVFSCFLFDCGPTSDYFCVFDPHESYISAAIVTDRSEFEAKAQVHKDRHQDQLKSLADKIVAELGGTTTTSPPARQGFTIPQYDQDFDLKHKKKARIEPRLFELPSPSKKLPCKNESDCGRWQFQCHNGECIPVYDVCNGIPQCSEGEDESEDACPATTVGPSSGQKQGQKVPPPVVHPRPDVGRPHGGRSGEDFNPSQQQSSGVQIPNNMVNVQPQQPQMPQNQWQTPYGNIPFSYYQQNLDISNLPSGYQPNPVPNYYNPGLNNNRYSMPMGQQQQQQQQQQPQQQQKNPNQGNAKPQGNSKSATEATTTSATSRSTTRSTSSIPAMIEDGMASDDVMAVLLKDIKDEDFIMETPSAAIFTLVVGIILTILFAILMACKIRGLRRRGRKRNLASDADSDYLVNGMYL